MAARKRTVLVLFLLASTLATFSSPASAAVDAQLQSDPDRIWDVRDADPGVSHTGRIRALIWDFEEYQGRMYVGGKYQTLVAPDGTTRDQAYLAAFDVKTGAWIESFDPQLDGAVYSLDVTDDGRLLAGGEMTGGIVAVDPTTGTLDANFAPEIRNSWGTPAVFDVEVVGSNVYAGGRFSKAQNTRLANLAKLNAQTGQLDPTWTPETELDVGTPRLGGQLVYGIEVDTTRDRVYVVGKFGSIDGNTDAAYFATLSQADGSFKNVPQGLPAETLNHREGFSMWHHDVKFRGDKVYIGGQAHQTLILNAADLSPTTSFFTNRGVGDNAAGGDTQVLFLGKNTLWAGCHCWGSVGPYTLGSYNNDRADGMQTYEEYRQWVADFRDVDPFGQQRVRGGYGIDLATGELSEQSFNLKGKGGAWALIEDSDGRLWMGGQFDTGNGRVGEGLARFSPAGADELAAVASCTVAPGAGNSVTVSWPEVAAADDYVIYRTVNDSPQYWRGRTTNLTFDDTTRTGDINYYVASKQGTELAERTQCVTEEPATLDPVATCTVTPGDGSAVTVSWPEVAAADDYVIYRTVNDSPQYWRGRTANLTFNDTTRTGDINYFVASKRGAEQAERTACD